MNNKILDLIGKRLIKGEKKYGHENVADDGRDFKKEALEEALDCAVYISAELIKLQQQNKGVKMRAKKNMENKIDDLARRMKLVEDALEEVSHSLIHTTTTHHMAEEVDLTKDIKTEITDKPKKRTRKKAETVATT